jgi:hypothetical protein
MTRLLVGCEVLRSEAERFIARTGLAVETRWIEVGLHREPPRLRKAIGDAVREGAERGAEAVLLLYGLCAGSLEGVRAEGAPLVLPRAHDCITLHLGSPERYAEELEREPGTYWCSRGVLEHDGTAAIAGAPDDAAPLPLFSEEGRTAFREELVETYGEEEAEYLMEAWAEGWTQHYRRLVLLAERESIPEADRERVRKAAARYGWEYEERAPDWRLLGMLLGGDWPEEAFLVVPPGHAIRATHDERIVESVPAPDGGGGDAAG